MKLVFYYDFLHYWSQSWLCCQKATGDLIMCVDVLHRYQEAATPYAASFSFLSIIFLACCYVYLSGNVLKWFVAKHLIYLYMVLQTICNSTLAPTPDFIYQTFNIEHYIALVIPYCLTVWKRMLWDGVVYFLTRIWHTSDSNNTHIFTSKKKGRTKNMRKFKMKICLWVKWVERKKFYYVSIH